LALRNFCEFSCRGCNDGVQRHGLINCSLGVNLARNLVQLNGRTRWGVLNTYLEYLEKLKTASGEIVAIVGSTIGSITKPVAVVNCEKLRDCWTHLTDLPPIRTCDGRIWYPDRTGPCHANYYDRIPLWTWRREKSFQNSNWWTLQEAVGVGNEANAAQVHRVFTSTDADLQLVEQLRRPVTRNRLVRVVPKEVENSPFNSIRIWLLFSQLRYWVYCHFIT